MNLPGLNFGSDPPYRECRQCGRRVDDADEHCPNCGSSDIAVYDL